MSFAPCPCETNRETLPIGERPVYSRKFRLKKSAEPSGNLRQTIAGIVSMTSRRRSSIVFDSLSASRLWLLALVWRIVPSTRLDLAVVRASVSLPRCFSCTGGYSRYGFLVGPIVLQPGGMACSLRWTVLSGGTRQSRGEKRIRDSSYVVPGIAFQLRQVP